MTPFFLRCNFCNFFRLVGLHRLSGPQQLHVFLVLGPRSPGGTPGEVPQEGIVEGDNHLCLPDGHLSFDVAQDTAGLLLVLLFSQLHYLSHGKLIPYSCISYILSHFLNFSYNKDWCNGKRTINQKLTMQDCGKKLPGEVHAAYG